MKKYIFSESQIKKIVDEVLAEQMTPEDGDDRRRANWFNPDDSNDTNIEPNTDPTTPEEPEQTNQPEIPGQEVPSNPGATRENRPRQLSKAQRVRQKWEEENPAVTDQIANDTMDFFRTHKERLKEYKNPDEFNPQTGRRNVNSPEVEALAIRFPELIPVLSDPVKLKDVENYKWEHMEFLIDRVSSENASVIAEVSLEGLPPERQKEVAKDILKKWPRKIVNEGGVIVIRCESQQDAIKLGQYQHVLNSEAKRRGVNPLPNNWCITHGPGEGVNLYFNYRDRRSYYFCLDENLPEDHDHHMSVIQPIKPDHTEAPYVITTRRNFFQGEMEGVSWKTITQKHPVLEGKESLFKYFPKTAIENKDVNLNRINFIPNTPENPNPDDFAIQRLSVQKAYVDSGRLINNARCFRTLPHTDPPINLKKLYISKTTLQDVKKRFASDDPNDPFAILSLIEAAKLTSYLEMWLVSHLHLPGGVQALKMAMIGVEFKQIFYDPSKKLALFQQRQGRLVGVFNSEQLLYLKPMEYFLSQSKPLVEMSNGQIKQYILNRYTTNNTNDYFYFIVPRENIAAGSPNFMKALYYGGPEGDQLLSSGKFRILKY